ncbi:MAG: hypothetical protein L3J46_10290, partial [Kangiellaceae bacterium]|nr:hypothetical protein [Kangiellaceae bacterium]
MINAETQGKQQTIPTGNIRDNIPMVFVDSLAKLEEVVGKWLKLEWLAVDTEFERRTSFYAKLALVQIYDGEKIYLIDPFEVDFPKELKKVFESP